MTSTDSEVGGWKEVLEPARQRDLRLELRAPALQAALKRAGISTGRLPDGRRGFRFHDMRHSTASIMAARGERPEVIQRVMATRRSASPSTDT